MEKLGISMQKICSQGITVLTGYTPLPHGLTLYRLEKSSI